MSQKSTILRLFFDLAQLFFLVFLTCYKFIHAFLTECSRLCCKQVLTTFLINVAVCSPALSWMKNTRFKSIHRLCNARRSFFSIFLLVARSHRRRKHTIPIHHIEGKVLRTFFYPFSRLMFFINTNFDQHYFKL